MAVVQSGFAENFIGNNLTADSPRVMGFEMATTQEQDLFRPGIADSQKIGFFSLDRTTQTDSSDIIDIKDLTDNVGQLLEDANSMRRDINFAQSVLQADFETKLQKKSIEMYVRANEKISEIEKMHEERVSTVRRAFKQQLADALARMHSLYQKDFSARMDAEKSRKDGTASKWEKKYREAQAQAQRHEATINLLKEQIQEYQEQESARVYTWNSSEDDKSALSSRVERRTPSPDYAKEEEINRLHQQVYSLEDKVASLEDTCTTKDQQIQHINSRVESLSDQLEKERIMVEQLQTANSSLEKDLQSSTAQHQAQVQKLNHEKEDLQAASESDQAASRRMMEKARLEMEGDMEDRVRQIKEQALQQARQEMESLESSHSDKLRQLAEEKKMVEKLLAKEKSKEKGRSQDEMELETLRRNEQRMVIEIARLKKEIDRVHRTWERKFAILQASLHALKDESFLRQTMQRQAAQLHQAAISYAYDAPVGITPRGGHHSNHKAEPGTGHKKPLPDINVKGQRVRSPGGQRGRSPDGQRGRSPADYLSYTVSAPSGRATTLFSAEETQVMSGDENDFPGDMAALPSPPSRPAVPQSTHLEVPSVTPLVQIMVPAMARVAACTQY